MYSYIIYTHKCIYKYAHYCINLHYYIKLHEGFIFSPMSTEVNYDLSAFIDNTFNKSHVALSLTILELPVSSLLSTETSSSLCKGFIKSKITFFFDGIRWTLPSFLTASSMTLCVLSYMLNEKNMHMIK